MQFNIKHSVAIGLGIGLAAAYCLHLGSAQTEMGRTVRTGNLQSLSTMQAPGQIPAPDATDPANMAKLQPDLAPAPVAEQDLVENNFTPPETSIDFEDPLALSPAILEDVIDSPAIPKVESSANAVTHTDAESPGQDDRRALVASGNSTPRLIKNESVVAQPALSNRMKWKKNPFVGHDSNVRATFNSSQAVRSLQASSPEAAGASPLQLEELAAPTDAASVSQPEPTSILETEPILAPAESTPAENFVASSENLIAPAENLQGRQEETAAPSPSRAGLSLTAAQQAAQHIEYGKTLARRGATFAARQEFFVALNIIAQTKDENSESKEFSQALTAGFLALKEAEGFVIDNIEAGTTLDVASVIASHRSTVITQQEAQNLSPIQAMQRYFEFAQHKLDEACGGNVVSAEAFFCLGKLYTAMASQQSVPSNLDAFKSIVFHKASIQSDETNYRSSNELGVLMVQTGRLEDATEYFKQSLIINRTPQAWMNLAKTHRRLGETEFAELAEAEYRMAVQAPLENANSSTASIQWLPTNQFNSLAPTSAQHQVASRPADLPKPVTKENKLKSFTKSFSDRLKDLF